MKRLLLIDDDPEDQEFFIEQLLQYKSDVEVVSAFNGEQGLKLIYDLKPRWVFLDINLPCIDGLPLLELIKELLHAEKINVFIYSTCNNVYSKAKAFQLGARNYFRKAESIRELKMIFQQAFSVNLPVNVNS
ncbi:response regulator [Parafilimonas sp.]|uniref:response regulator n=1 Tax=Parafilimonas sp. TaxID=1969739 RepID=UPI0039E57E33